MPIVCGGNRWADDPAAIIAMQKKVPVAVGACLDLIERHLLKRPWVMGEIYTVADPYLFTLAQWLELAGVIPARIPHVIDHRQRMLERAAVQQAIAQELAS
jgi:glutathione S-transferase